MQRVSFRIPADTREDVLDGVLPLLPAGIVERPVGEDVVGDLERRRGAARRARRCARRAPVRRSTSFELRGRARRLARAAAPLRRRRGADLGPARGALAVRPARARGRAGGRGRARRERVRVGLAPDHADVPRRCCSTSSRAGGATDFGCGVGMLAIAAAKLGWAPVSGARPRGAGDRGGARERAPQRRRGRVRAGRRRHRRSCRSASCCWPTRRRPCSERLAAAITPQVRHVIVSGIVEGELEQVRAAYAAAGLSRSRGWPRTRGSPCGWGARVADLLDPDARRRRRRRVRPARHPARRRRAADLLLAAGRVQLPRRDPDRARAVPLRPHAAAGDARRGAAPARRPRPPLGGRGGVVGRLPRAGEPRRAARAARGDRHARTTRCSPGCTCSRSPTATPAPCTSWPRPRSSGPPSVSFDAAALLDWYERVRRPLPWRETRDPYALLVSEVMLQQTQAARVVPYYEAFLARFPDPAALAAAPTADVLARLERPRLQPPRARAPGRGAAVAAEHGWPEDLTRAAGRRRLHGGRRGLVRLGRARSPPSTPTSGA